jgi:hypothetical protein
MPTACPVKTDLILAYSDIAKIYCEAVTQLHDRINVASKQECDELMQQADETRFASEKARLAVENHINQHGC